MIVDFAREVGSGHLLDSWRGGSGPGLMVSGIPPENRRFSEELEGPASRSPP